MTMDARNATLSKGRVAIFSRVDRQSRIDATPEASRFRLIFEAPAKAGILAEPAIYYEEGWRAGLGEPHSGRSGQAWSQRAFARPCIDWHLDQRTSRCHR